MAAKMIGQGHPIFFYENTEGGHGGGMSNDQRAYSAAIQYTYFWKMLKPSNDRGGDDQQVTTGSSYDSTMPESASSAAIPTYEILSAFFFPLALGMSSLVHAI